MGMTCLSYRYICTCGVASVGLTSVIGTMDDCERLVIAAMAHGEVGCYENNQKLPVLDLVLLGNGCKLLPW